MKILKYLLLLIFCMPLFGYGQNKSEGLFRKKIAYEKPKRLFAKRKFLIFNIPKNHQNILQTMSNHGFTASIYYPDSSTIYYWDDKGMMPPNKNNYETISFEPPPGWNMGDTVVFGLQTNGKYWKEVFVGQNWIDKSFTPYWIGYKNVPKEKVMLFDKVLDLFKRDK